MYPNRRLTAGRISLIALACQIATQKLQEDLETQQTPKTDVLDLVDPRMVEAYEPPDAAEYKCKRPL